IGAADVPFLALSEVERNYSNRDSSDWVDYWTELPYANDGSIKPPSVRKFGFPTIFPIRSVLANRVAIVEPRSADAICTIHYIHCHVQDTAAWELDINIGDPIKLAKALDDAGFDGKALIKAANAPEVKETLRKNVEMALDIGICGVPTYTIRDHIVFGQDRLNHVADLVMGWSPDNGNVKL
ncbi:hypothetical protein HK101_007046, partial [Irineochytrium annulatum]